MVSIIFKKTMATILALSTKALVLYPISAIQHERVGPNVVPASPVVAIERIGKGSTAQNVGLRSEDLLLAWRRMQDSQGELKEGTFDSIFTWGWLVMEEIPSGKIILTTKRNGMKITRKLRDGFYEISPRPQLPRNLLSVYRELNTTDDIGSVQSKVNLLEQSLHTSNTCGARDEVSWVRLRESEVLERAQRWDESRVTLQEAVKNACSPEAKAQLQVLWARFFARRGELKTAAAIFNTAASYWKDQWGERIGYTRILLLQADLASLQDDFITANQQINRAVEIIRSIAPDGLVFSDILNEQAALAHKRGDLIAAYKFARSALAIREKLAPESHLVAQSLSNLAGIAVESGDVAKQERLLLRALKIEEVQHPASPQVAGILSNLGSLAWERENFARAERYLMQSWKIREKIGYDNRPTANLLRNLGALFKTRGQNRSAIYYWEKALAMTEKIQPDSLDVADLKCLLASAYRNDQPDIADRYFQSAFPIYRNLAPDSGDFAQHLVNAGFFASSRYDFDKAHYYYMQALDILSRISPKSPQLAILLDNLGNLFRKRRDFEMAEDYFKKAIQIREGMPAQASRIVGSLRGLGYIALEAEDPEKALQYFRRVADIEKDLRRQGLRQVSGIVDVGSVLCRLGKYEECEAYLHHALRIAQTSESDSDDVATILGNLGVAYLEQGQMDQAKQYLEKSLKIVQRLAPGSFHEAHLLSRLGLVYKEFGDLAQAGRLLRSSVGVLERQIDRLTWHDDVKAKLREEEASIYWETLKFLVDTKAEGEAFRLLEQYKARSFLDQLARRDLTVEEAGTIDLQKTYRTLVREYEDVQRKILQGTTERRKEDNPLKRLRRLRFEIEEIQSAIRKGSPALASLRGVQPIRSTDVGSFLKPEGVLLSFAVGEEKSFVFVETETGLSKIEELQIGRRELDREVRQFRAMALINSQRLNQFNEPGHMAAPLGRELYQKLLAPIEHILETSQRILILPDGPLHMLAWGALVRDRSPQELGERAWEYLAEWKPVHISISATVYAELQKLRRDKSVLGPASIAVFGDPVVPPNLGSNEGRGLDLRVNSIAERGFDFAPLPATRREAEQIGDLFPGAASVFLGAEATEEQAKAVGKEFRYLHFATHSVLDEQIPLNSAVVLSIPEKFDEGKDNGLLQAWEIFEKVRLDADLVTLSGCETGLGKEIGGEGLIGLVRAFQYAGARSVLASLWNIRDRPTAELMVRFYRYLRGGKTKDEALRAAQMDFIRGPIRITNEKGEVEEHDWSHPYYWAAFQLYGDWQ